jgi:hypothetical protein
MKNSSRIYYTRLERITPEIAKQYLESNTSNRTINANFVNFLAEQIKLGKWIENGESIKFNKSGVLVDGQHRLLAVVKLGLPIKTNVVRGCDDDSFATLGNARPRSARDTMSTLGIANYSCITSIIRKYISLMRNLTIAGDGDAGLRFSHSDYVDEYKKHSQLYDELGTKCQFYTRKLKAIPTAAIGAYIIYLILNKNYSKEYVYKFFDTLYDLQDNSVQTIVTLRMFLIREVQSVTKHSGLYVQQILIKAWNAYSCGI